MPQHPNRAANTTVPIGRQLARNSFLNLLSQAWVVILIVIVSPGIVHGLGEQRFGILALSWALIGYFGFLDFGLSQAAVKFLAELLVRKRRAEAATTLWVALCLNLVLGVIGAGLLAALAPVLSRRVFEVALPLQGEATTAFYIVAVGLPFVLLQGTLRGLPSALQRFDIVSVVNVCAATAQWVAAALLIGLDFGLLHVLASTLTVRALVMGVYAAVAIKLLPEALSAAKWDLPSARQLASYGSWIAISQFLAPILMYLDRFLIASIVSVAALTYYSVPYEVVTRLWVIPGSLSATLFPAFSEQSAQGRGSIVKGMYLRSARYVFLLVAPIVVVVCVYAEELLSLWMGQEFGNRSALVLRVLAVGVLVNSIAFIPDVAIKGLGRPDLVTKLHLAEVPAYTLLALMLIWSSGIDGAAIAWSVRMSADALALFFLGNRLLGISPGVRTSLRLLAPAIAMGAVLLMSKGSASASAAGVVVIGAAILVYALLGWLLGLDRSDRRAISRLREALVTTARRVRW